MSTAKTMTRSRASQKSGMATPRLEPTVTTRSLAVPLRTPAMMPAGMPMMMARSMPPMARERVTGNRAADSGGDRLAGVEERAPEVTVDDPVQPAQVLPPERLVQMELTGDLGHLGRIGVHPAGERQRRVPGEEEHEAEDGEGDQQQERDRDQQPADDEREEGAT